MVGLPVTFPLPSESAISSYSWTDIADGSGRAEYYGVFCNQTGSATYKLLGFAGVSFHDDASEAVIQSSAGTYNFDTTPFNTPRVAKGTVYASFTGASTGSEDIKIKLIKVSGGVPSDISAQVTTTTLTSGHYYSIMLSIPLTAQTKFKIGDYLRVELITSADATIFIDPLSSTRLPFKINVPFKIEL